nr:secreted protein [Thraustotheca clavata]
MKAILLSALVASVAAADLQMCTTASITTAASGVATEMTAPLSKCATDMGVTAENVLSPVTPWTDAETKKFTDSTNCASVFSILLKAFKSITPPCLLQKTPTEVNTGDLASFTAAQYLAMQKSAASNSTSNSTASGNATAAPAPAANATTAAPAKSSASGLATGMVALTAVAVAMM